ncbi:MAG: hypothetical protein ACTHJT_04295 [Cytophaga sp.]|uniref:hypothetical protein n=1 Tax=Cytophaga sp. TaxID=29535 RepID=UPI003F7DCDC2
MTALILKYKNIFILLFLVVLIYQFAISKTIEEYTLSRELDQQLVKATTSEESIRTLEAEKKVIKIKLNKFSSDSVKNKEYIFHLLAEFCKQKRIRLRDFPEEGITQKGGYLLETNKIVAEGEYANLLQLINHIEYDSNIGKISSVRFYMYKDHKLQKDVLLTEIYIQNLSLR